MSKVKTKQVKKISPTELKTWLDGYCAAHPENWAPTPEQWVIIRDKIFALKDFKADGDEGVSRGAHVPVQSFPTQPAAFAAPPRNVVQHPIQRATGSTLATGAPANRTGPIKTPDDNDISDGSAFT